MKIKKAAASTAAKSNTEPKKSYCKKKDLSRPNLKELLGVLLLRLLAGQAEPDNWQLFDGLLRRLYAGGVI